MSLKETVCAFSLDALLTPVFAGGVGVFNTAGGVVAEALVANCSIGGTVPSFAAAEDPGTKLLQPVRMQEEPIIKVIALTK